MANVQTPQEKVAKTPVKAEPPQLSQKTKSIYCILCRRFYLKHEEHVHMHSMLHHRELESVLGKDSFHDCQACKASSMGLNEYAQHISTVQHKAKLKSLMSRNVKPLSIFKTLSTETITWILERNKTLKKKEKKAIKKKKKKLKQVAGMKRAHTLQGTAVTKAGASKVGKQGQYRQVQLNQSQGAQHQGSNNAVFQNKENKVFSEQRPPHSTESTLHYQSRRLAPRSGEPAGERWYHENSSLNNQCSTVKVENSQVGRFHKTQVGATDSWHQITKPAVSQYSYHSREYDSATYRDFTSDHLPENGAIIFSPNQGETTGQESLRCSAPPAPANKSISAAPIRDVDVTAVLRQIRRELGVREPCRADREARRQKSEASFQVADRTTSQQNGTEVAQPAGISAPTETPQYSEKSSGGADRLPNNGNNAFQVATDSLTSPKRSTEMKTSSEPYLNKPCKVRVAHKSGQTQGEKETGYKSTTKTLLSLSGARSNQNLIAMYEEVKRKKAQGMPRFGIELSNRSTRQESSVQAQDFDLPLSEGFHWESFPDSLSGPNSILPPPLQDTADHTETQSDSQSQEALGQPAAAQAHSSSSQAAATIQMKVEPNFEELNADLRGGTSAGKRKHSLVTGDGLYDREPSGRKKKTKSNKDQDQMDQLLAVSLREEELSQSLQDLDRSLVQARNALQAAYAEVQRILLLRQQFTSEVNSLRAKRIEILQGMQEGYSGASNVGVKATTSPSGGAAGVRPPSLPSSSLLPASSTRQSPASAPTLSITPPLPAPLALPALAIKQEMCHLPTVGQASHFATAVPVNTNAAQVPLNQPVSLFPSNLLPPLLLPQSHLAAPLTAAAGANQSNAESSTFANTRTSLESFVRQQEQETREGLQDCAKTVMVAKQPAQAERNPEKETEGNLKEKVPTPDTCVPEREKKQPVAEDAGNESDDSVEMICRSNMEVIDIGESDCEDSHEKDVKVPAQPQEAPRSESVEFSSASTQTSVQQSEVDSKIQPSALQVKDGNTPAASADDEEPFLGEFLNHDGPVHGLQVHDDVLYTCSGDNTARAYSLVTRECLTIFEGHTNKINCLLVSSSPNMPARLYTGSSDQTIRCYSIKSKKCLEQLSLPDRVLCLHIAWNILYAGTASGSVASYDVKTLKQLDVFECHGPRGVSSLGTAQEGARRLLLVGSYDSTISVRDAKSGLLLRSLEGHTKTVLCMKVVNDLVFSGSSDTSVHAHNIHTGELVRIYKGHGHAVTSIVILGKVMVTACLDKLVRVYELQSHDRLQVYGGHSDMVMCMAVHKSVIYTGCYDGSVQAVKLNLMKNYRCWWQNCSLIFGMQDHLLQHLTKDHSSPDLQTVKCRWRGCNSFFATQHSVRQEFPEHMQSHVENDSKVQP
ncbi:zinc finger protein 106 isoform X2 [Archocentrus centrarchus]|nr:zinc finger protein 106-like isoform X2 [Archocentrus centrarchus]XP_030576668.1 zinc finger protein 106-like isoform X2 [Archocentrus centrarchus]